jgi:hypothetical protein
MSAPAEVQTEPTVEIEAEAAKRLPLEVILCILESSLPAGGPDRIVNPSHCQALVSFTRVSRSTYSLATRLLRRHCVYIDSADRLIRFDVALRAAHASTLTTLPPTLPLDKIEAMYTMPLTGDWRGISLAIKFFVHVLSIIGPSLRRLVANVWSPHHGRYADNDGRIREGFAHCTNLEEFVCLGWLHQTVDNPDPNYLAPSSSLAKLRRLCLSSADLQDERLWRQIALLPALEHVVLVRSTLLRINKWNVKQALSEHWSKNPNHSNYRTRPIKIVFVDLEFAPQLVDMKDRLRHDPDNVVTVSSFEVPLPWSAKIRADHQCLIATTSAALQQDTADQGYLWDWVGKIL